MKPTRPCLKHKTTPVRVPRLSHMGRHSRATRALTADTAPRSVLPKSGRVETPLLLSPLRVAEPIPATRERPDALSLYMREVGEVALLTPQQEAALARRVQAGDAGARDQMIRANLRFVIKIAREYDNLGLPLLDLINEGNIGLMKAVERFDPDKGAKLSTYSSWWIRQQIRRALAGQGKTIRMPVHAVDQIYHLRKAEVRLREILDREPTEAELAEVTGISLRRVSELQNAAIRPASLDAPVGQADSSTLAELVPDENATAPDRLTDDSDAIHRVRELLERLPERESTILRARFGLDDGRERTLETIGASLGVTRERIRQLQQLALKKLRQMLEQTSPGLNAA